MPHTPTGYSRCQSIWSRSSTNVPRFSSFTPSRRCSWPQFQPRRGFCGAYSGRPVLENPSRRFAAHVQPLHLQRVHVQPVDRRLPITAGPHVPKGADHVDVVAEQGGSVKVRRREHGLRIAVDRNRPVTLVHEDIVVDAEVGVVEVLVLAADLHRAAVWQKGQRLAVPLRAPDRLPEGAALLLEPLDLPRRPETPLRIMACQNGKSIRSGLRWPKVRVKACRKSSGETSARASSPAA